MASNAVEKMIVIVQSTLLYFALKVQDREREHIQWQLCLHSLRRRDYAGCHTQVVLSRFEKGFYSRFSREAARLYEHRVWGNKPINYWESWSQRQLRNKLTTLHSFSSGGDPRDGLQFMRKHFVPLFFPSLSDKWKYMFTTKAVAEVSLYINGSTLLHMYTFILCDLIMNNI